MTNFTVPTHSRANGLSITKEMFAEYDQQYRSVLAKIESLNPEALSSQSLAKMTASNLETLRDLKDSIVDMKDTVRSVLSSHTLLPLIDAERDEFSVLDHRLDRFQAELDHSTGRAHWQDVINQKPRNEFLTAHLKASDQFIASASGYRRLGDINNQAKSALSALLSLHAVSETLKQVPQSADASVSGDRISASDIATGSDTSGPVNVGELYRTVIDAVLDHLNIGDDIDEIALELQYMIVDQYPILDYSGERIKAGLDSIVETQTVGNAVLATFLDALAYLFPSNRNTQLERLVEPERAVEAIGCLYPLTEIFIFDVESEDVPGEKISRAEDRIKQDELKDRLRSFALDRLPVLIEDSASSAAVMSDSSSDRPAKRAKRTT